MYSAPELGRRICLFCSRRVATMSVILRSANAVSGSNRSDCADSSRRFRTQRDTRGLTARATIFHGRLFFAAAGQATAQFRRRSEASAGCSSKKEWTPRSAKLPHCRCGLSQRGRHELDRKTVAHRSRIYYDCRCVVAAGPLSNSSDRQSNRTRVPLPRANHCMKAF